MSDLEYYPGSMTPVRDYGNPDVAKLVLPEDGHLDLGRPAKVENDVEYFTIGPFAVALNRTPVTLRHWESEGILPPARWGAGKVQGRGEARWYSRKQIEDTVQIAHEEGILTETWKAIKDTEFAERVARIW